MHTELSKVMCSGGTSTWIFGGIVRFGVASGIRVAQIHFDLCRKLKQVVDRDFLGFTMVLGFNTKSIYHLYMNYDLEVILALHTMTNWYILC